MKQYKYNKIKSDIESIRLKIIDTINNHNFIINNKCFINVCNESNENLVRSIVENLGYKLNVSKYTHPEYTLRCVDYFIVG